MNDLKMNEAREMAREGIIESTRHTEICTNFENKRLQMGWLWQNGFDVYADCLKWRSELRHKFSLPQVT
jgi:hypothetical protein